MSGAAKSQVRLYCLLARDAPRAVVFRRGPTRRVLVTLWETDIDRFHEGQWFKGRVYERRCDLSPSGTKLIYFAANYKQPYFSWTAISNPPFLTALALWAKGDAWGGGGLFTTENQILLNHQEQDTELADGFNLPRNFRVKPLGKSSGRGEDSPIMDTRLIRDGWRVVQDGQVISRGSRHRISFEYEPPIVWAKPCQRSRRYELRMCLRGLHESDGPWYLIDHVVRDKQTGAEVTLNGEWADWDRSGDLLFSRGGQLYRLGLADGKELDDLNKASLLTDLTERKFEEKPPTAAAKEW